LRQVVVAFILRDDLVEIPVEDKAGEQQGVNPETLLQQCTNQVLSRLAEHAGIGFGFGVDTHATGVILTPAYVKIIQLRLREMGTPEVKLLHLETKCMPLV